MEMQAPSSTSNPGKEFNDHSLQPQHPLQPPSSTSKPGKAPPRFVFNIIRDIELLKSAVSSNPWQLGKSKWAEVCKSLKAMYGYDIKPRTAKERVDLLVAKIKKEELESKTGTEVEQSEREDLLRDIILMQEQENIPIVQEIGFETIPDSDALQDSTYNRRSEKLAADEERDKLLAQMSNNDSAPKPDGVRKKRTSLAREEEMVLKKLKHDMDMELLRFKSSEDSKEKELAVSNRTLDLEYTREKRLEEEGRRREEEDKRRYEENKRRDEMMMMMFNILKPQPHV